MDYGAYLQGSSPTLQNLYSPQQTSTQTLQGTSPNLQPTVAPSYDTYLPNSPSLPLTQASPLQDPAAQQAAAQAAALKASNIGSINAQLGQLDPTLNTGLSNIGNSYQRNLNGLEDQRGIAERNYNQGTSQNTQNYAQTRSGILQNTSAKSSALQRLLGMNGSGNSSAAYEQAPYAAGLEGSQNLSQAQNTFGNNETSLNQNWQDTLRGYGKSKDELNQSKYSQENALRQSIAQSRLSLQDKLAQANGGTIDQGTLQDLLSQITQLGQQYQNPVMPTGQVSYAAPAQNQYSLGLNSIASPQGGAASSVDPAFAGLLGQKRDLYGNILTA